jgi:hypothetical protein
VLNELADGDILVLEVLIEDHHLFDESLYALHEVIEVVLVLLLDVLELLPDTFGILQCFVSSNLPDFSDVVGVFARPGEALPRELYVDVVLHIGHQPFLAI